MAIHLIYFLGKKHVLNKRQFGFRKNKSAEVPFATVIENIIENLNNTIQLCNIIL
jgi:hypothetical protein